MIYICNFDFCPHNSDMNYDVQVSREHLLQTLNL